MTTQVSGAITKIPGGTFDPENHCYRNEAGIVIPSTTQVFSLLGLVNYDYIQQEVLERKSQIGIAVHSAIEFLCQGDLDWDSVADEAMPYVLSIEDWMKAVGFISESQEGQGIHTLGGMQYGYMYDHRGTMMFHGKRRHAILDLKTCVSPSVTWKWQTGAYEPPQPRLPNGEQYLRVALQAKPDRPATPFYYDKPSDKQEFQVLLAASIIKLNNGFSIK